MNEKRAIIDELLTQAQICLDEKANIVVSTVQDYESSPSSCSNCGKSLREIYTRSEELTGNGNDYDLVVLKCEKCDLFYAIWIQPLTYDPTFLEPAVEDEKAGGRILEPTHWKQAGKPQWGEGIRPRFPRKSLIAYRRATLRQGDINRRLNSAVQGKSAEMYKQGLSNETINIARNMVLNYLKNNSVTTKKLVNLYAAAIYEASNEELRCIGGAVRRGEKISERRLEEIFGVTRKTIRKWRKRLPHRLTDLYL